MIIKIIKIIMIIKIIKIITIMREGVSGHLPANPPLPLDHCTWNALFTMMMTIVIMIMMIMIPLDHWNTTAHSPYNAIMMIDDDEAFDAMSTMLSLKERPKIGCVTFLGPMYT